jgi:subtilisin-like proprotein convertase family protein
MRSYTYAVVQVVVWFGAWVPARAASTTYYYEQQFHLPIPAVVGATQGWMDDAVLSIPSHIAITDLDVTITLTHTCDFDLQIILQSPSGTGVLLNMYNPFTDYFVGANYDHTIFDDEAAISIHDGTAPFIGRFRPLDALSIFDGKDAYGSWRLRIRDSRYADTGELLTFGLYITTLPAPTAIDPSPEIRAIDGVRISL